MAEKLRSRLRNLDEEKVLPAESQYSKYQSILGDVTVACFTTSATPSAVITVPAIVVSVIGSSNKNQAINAVTGGTRYIRLVTEAAAPH